MAIDHMKSQSIPSQAISSSLIFIIFTISLFLGVYGAPTGTNLSNVNKSVLKNTEALLKPQESFH